MNKNCLSRLITLEMIEQIRKHNCIACGLCCKWGGYVFVYMDDINRISSTLNVSNEQFLINSCNIIHWTFKGESQYRIVLNRNLDNECIYLEYNLCKIHEFKPRVCVAGPVGSHFVFNKTNFWFYVNNSPSFLNEEINKDLEKMNNLFIETWNYDYHISLIKKYSDLTKYLGISKALLDSMPLITINRKEK